MKYAAYLVERNENDKPIFWQPIGPVRETLGESLTDAAQSMHPMAEVAEMVHGFNVLTPRFA